MTGRPADPLAVNADLATMRKLHPGHRWDYHDPTTCEGCTYDAALDRVEAELSRLREERDASREHSREASEMYVQANEQITELLQQQSFMERKLAAQREDIERLATRVETAEAEVERLRSDKDERDWRTLEIVTKQAEAAEAALADTRRALEEIADTARWYAENDARLAHEVDHCLCVEILSMAENALAAGEDDFDPSPTAHLQGLGEGTGPSTLTGVDSLKTTVTVGRAATCPECGKALLVDEPGEPTGPTEEQG